MGGDEARLLMIECLQNMHNSLLNQCSDPLTYSSLLIVEPLTSPISNLTLGNLDELYQSFQKAFLRSGSFIKILCLAEYLFWNISFPLCSRVDPSYISVRAQSSFWDKAGIVVPAQTCFMHPEYTGTWANNIALVKLNGVIKFTNASRVGYYNIKNLKVVNATYDVSGWGVRSSVSIRGYLL